MAKRLFILLLMAIVLSACSSAEDKEKELISSYLSTKYAVTPTTTEEELAKKLAPFITEALAEEQAASHALALPIEVAKKYNSPLQVASISAIPLEVSGEYRYVAKLVVDNRPVEQHGELSIKDGVITYDQHQKKK